MKICKVCIQIYSGRKRKGKTTKWHFMTAMMLWTKSEGRRKQKWENIPKNQGETQDKRTKHAEMYDKEAEAESPQTN